MEVPTDKLMAEVARRMDCQNKPEKHVILVGTPCACWKRMRLHLSGLTCPAAAQALQGVAKARSRRS